MIPFHKIPAHRNKAYLAWIRKRPCSVSGVEGSDVVAHHVRSLGGGGMGLKPSDYMCLPLSNEQHTRLHNEGEKTFWKRHSLCPSMLISMNLLVYLAEAEVDFRLLLEVAEEARSVDRSRRGDETDVEELL